jgi:hypothetical protein
VISDAGYDAVIDKIVDMGLKGITLTQANNPHGVVIEGERTINGMVLAFTRLIDLKDMIECASLSALVLKELDHIEHALENPNVIG